MHAAGLIPALLCCSVATVLLLKWRRRRRLLRTIAAAQRRRERALEQMGDLVGKFKAQNPGHQPAPILSLGLPELCGKLRDGSLSPESVFYTYMDKTLKVTRDINCVTDYLEDSESQLRQVKNLEKKGLLYGVPVSIKDSINCKGHDSTLGLLKRLNQPAAADAVVVQVLKHQGAIPFVKTNVPQSLLSFDCNNVVFGQTVNPLDHTKTPGGSSGGEVALIKSGGSILGIGTDIGGSLRIPAAFCGICGIKPTGDRISKKGVVPCIRGQKAVAAGIGPMARDVESLALCLRALLCDEMFRLDPTVPPLPFNEQVYSDRRPLRIGYYEASSYILASPSMKRAVRETKQLLEKAGHTLVPFEPINIEYFTTYLSVSGLFGDGGATFLELLKGEPEGANRRDMLSILKTPVFLRSLISWTISRISPRLSEILRSMKEKSVKELWKLHTDITEYFQEFTDEWRRLDLDVLLCPVLGPAFNIGYPEKYSVGSAYTLLYNYLDCPAGVLPVTTVTREDEEELKSLTGHYNDLWDKVFEKAVKEAVGLPVAVQCVALPWQDELCLRFMKEVETLTMQKASLP